MLYSSVFIDCKNADCANCKPIRIGEITTKNLISVAPAPTNGLFKITAKGKSITFVTVYNIAEKSLYERAMQRTSEAAIDLRDITICMVANTTEGSYE
jgi:hypothetical protein